MAGITSNFPCKPLLSRRTTPPSPSPISLSSLESSITGVRLSNLQNLLKIDSTRSVCFTSQSSITARFGGYRPPPRPNRPREKRPVEVDADPSLDISSVRSPTVRLIDAKQNMIGVMSKSEAIQMAEDAELDLVILSPDAEPPVLRIMDYNKHRYEQQKKKREQQKKSAAIRMDMKELKMGYNIDVHDYSVRLRAAEKFLKEGNKVKIIVNLKGRENEFKSIATDLLMRFQNDIGELGTKESENLKDRNMFVVLLPNKTILQKGNEQPKKKEKPAVKEISASETDLLKENPAVKEISASETELLPSGQ